MKNLSIKKQPNVAHLSMFVLLTTILLAATANASTDEKNGFDIAARSDRSDVGFGDTFGSR